MCCTHAFENEKLTYSTVKIGSLLSLEKFFLERYSRECKPIVVIVPSPSGYVDFNPATPSVSWHLEKGRTNINPWGQDSHSWGDGHAIIDILRHVSRGGYL
jgi:hypothetical protein